LLNRQIMGLDSAQEILVFVEKHRAEQDAINFATALQRIAKISAPHSCWNAPGFSMLLSEV
jgi:hypothetical protein